MVPSGCNFGYDILVYVGRALFLRHRRSREICDELATHNVHISPGEVEYLAMLPAVKKRGNPAVWRDVGAWILDATSRVS